MWIFIKYLYVSNEQGVEITRALRKQIPWLLPSALTGPPQMLNLSVLMSKTKYGGDAICNDFKHSNSKESTKNY